MERIEDNQWVDMIIDKIGSALVKVDESIPKSIELWKDLTKDIYDDLPTHDTTRQPNNGKSSEEGSSQDKSVDEVKERPIQHWAMCASKIPEGLIQELGDDDYFEVDWDHDHDDDDEKEEEKEDDEGAVSESSDEDMLEYMMSGNPYHLSKHASTSQKDVRVSEYCENMSEINIWTSDIHSQLCCYDRSEEDSGSSLRGRGGYELLKNDGMFDDLWEEVMEWMQKHGIMDEHENEDEDDKDEDDLSDKLQGFVDVKEEESIDSECDWVYVTRD